MKNDYSCGGSTTTVKVTSVSVYPACTTLKVGDWFYGASATVYPSNATNKTVTWRSSNTSVATVNASSGLIYAKATGSANIYATAADGSGKSDFLAVTVTNGAVLVNSVELNRSSLSLDIGKTFSLSATVCPENAANRSLSWSSSNPTVATVTGGCISALAKGTAIISATANDGSGKSASCTVFVNDNIQITSVTVSPKSKIMAIGESAYLTATYLPTNATNPCIYWVSSDTSVASVNSESGLVLARGVGTTTIYAAAQDGSKQKDSCSVKVTGEIPVTSVEIYPTSKAMTVGESAYLHATVYPENASYKTVIWITSNDKVAIVGTSGLITAKSFGTTTITATTVDGQFKSSCTISVTYCGGSNYRDVTQHHLVLQEDGYYVCSKCGYRIKSPTLQDKDILDEDDYYKVQACYLAIPYYMKLEEMSPKDERLKTNTLLYAIDDIRSKSEYAHQYEYVDSSGVYKREYTTVGQNDWFYMPLSINKANVNNFNILYYSEFAQGLVSLILGFILPTQVEHLFTAITLENAYDGAVALLSDLANKIGCPELGIIVNLITIGAAIDETIKVGDKVVTICLTVGAGTYVSKVIFTNEGNFKAICHSIE